MRPVLLTLHVGSREVGLHTYGLLIALGLAAGITLAAREARRRTMDVGRVLDFAFWGVVAGFVGSRVAYGLVNAGDFARSCAGRDGPRGFGAVLWDCTRIFHVWEGGLVFYGGVVGTALVAVIYARRTGWTFWTITDVFAPGVALGHALGRFGCYAAGCCFGKATTGGWGASFPSGSVAFDELSSLGLVAPGASFTPPLHPTQLYEAFGELLIFAALMLARGRLRSRPGALALTYAAAYAVLRFIVELFRGDVARRFVVELTTPGLARALGVPASEPVLLSVGHLGSLLLLAACALALGKRRRAWAPSPNAKPSKT
jgi:phosphatidylglycerol---prolipoprotein diacylglyceryl transferase